MLPLVFGLACGAEVVVEQDATLAGGEGGYMGTGEPDRDSAVEEACGLLKHRLPECPQETCLDYAAELLTVGELSGCGEEAVAVLYCIVQEANQYVCMGHHACESLETTYDDCWMTTCSADPNRCGLS